MVNTVDTEVLKVVKKDAFRVLMGDRLGDTLVKKTPFRKKTKRLEKITSASKSIMDNWVLKSSHKGDNQKL